MALCLLVLVAAQPAGAAFPGKNGKIAFQSNRNGPVEIYATTPAGATERVTVSNGSSDPAYSPDGSRIAFVANGTGGNDIFVMNADGTGRKQLPSTGSADLQPAWSPDGEKIAFVSNTFALNEQSDYEIWVMDADGTGTPAPITSAPFSETQPAWSPDGTKIAYSSEGVDVWVMDVNGGTQDNLTPNSPTGCSPTCYQGGDDAPAWSPDGTQIAYVHGYGTPTNPYAGGGKPNIWTMDPNGNGKTNISDSAEESAFSPAWSPDGTKIAYVGIAPASTERNISVMNADGTDPREIDTAVANDINPDWQNDSTPPTVKKAAPTGSGVSPKANVTATFSEAMDPATLDGTTFKLVKKGTTRTLAARVTYSAATAKATLNPDRNLRSGATYKATVTTGAEDAAGNALAANKTWGFKVR